jgi:hypothetical protein
MVYIVILVYMLSFIYLLLQNLPVRTDLKQLDDKTLSSQPKKKPFKPLI